MNSPSGFVETRTILRSLIDVQEPRADSVVGQPEFLARCNLVMPHGRERPIDRIFVDGFVGKCYINSWKVYSDSLEDGLRLFAGFAFSGTQWWEHAWCMIGNTIVESTHTFLAYYGAELFDDQLATIRKKYGQTYPPSDATDVRVYTVADGARRVVPYDPDKHTIGIGRERSLHNGEILVGLGRWKRLIEERAPAGWDDPKLDIYNDYDANRSPSALDPPPSAPLLADG